MGPLGRGAGAFACRVPFSCAGAGGSTRASPASPGGYPRGVGHGVSARRARSGGPPTGWALGWGALLRRRALGGPARRSGRSTGGCFRRAGRAAAVVVRTDGAQPAAPDLPRWIEPGSGSRSERAHPRVPLACPRGVSDNMSARRARSGGPPTGWALGWGAPPRVPLRPQGAPPCGAGAQRALHGPMLPPCGPRGRRVFPWFCALRSPRPPARRGVWRLAQPAGAGPGC